MFPAMTQMDFKRTIQIMMAERGIRSARELAERSGLHVNTIHNVFNSRNIPLRSLPAIAKALDVPASEILRRAEVAND